MVDTVLLPVTYARQSRKDRQSCMLFSSILNTVYRKKTRGRGLFLVGADAILAAMAHDTAVIHEVFSGIQGEGTLVGFRQIFVRFHGCNLACAYCDTPASHGAPPATCNCETRAGSRDVVALMNPLTVDDLSRAVLALQETYPHHSVSLTGGEPLLHHGFLNRFLPCLHAAGIPSFLETNGVAVAELAALTTVPSYIAMDMKLPSTAGVAAQWERHTEFLAVAARQLATQTTDSLQVKIVFGEDSLADVARATAILAACDATIPCILQPVTAHPGGPAAPGADTVLEAQRMAASLLRRVRVIPQTHVMLGQW